MAEPKKDIVDGKVRHYSVGALIVLNDKYLLIERAIPPFGFAGVAGHIDEGETPEQALRHEVEEEVGLKITGSKLIFEEMIDWNWCNDGVTGHYWYVYQCSVEGDIKRNYRETKSAEWYSKERIKDLKLEPVWEYWFKKLKII